MIWQDPKKFSELCESLWTFQAWQLTTNLRDIDWKGKKQLPVVVQPHYLSIRNPTRYHLCYRLQRQSNIDVFIYELVKGRWHNAHPHGRIFFEMDPKWPTLIPASAPWWERPTWCLSSWPRKEAPAPCSASSESSKGGNQALNVAPVAHD